MSRLPVKRALVSVYDKTGLVPFAQRLAAAGVEIVSSGGTAVALTVAGIEVKAWAERRGRPPKAAMPKELPAAKKPELAA